MNRLRADMKTVLRYRIILPYCRYLYEVYFLSDCVTLMVILFRPFFCFSPFLFPFQCSHGSPPAFELNIGLFRIAKGSTKNLVKRETSQGARRYEIIASILHHIWLSDIIGRWILESDPYVSILVRGFLRLTMTVIAILSSSRRLAPRCGWRYQSRTLRLANSSLACSGSYLPTRPKGYVRRSNSWSGERSGKNIYILN